MIRVARTAVIFCMGISAVVVSHRCAARLPAADVSKPVGTNQLAQQILDTTGFRGGLIVHVGCRDGRLTAALGANPRYLVHGLDRDPANVAAARKHIKSLGRYGQVSVDRWDGEHLPYAESVVNLLLVETDATLSTGEMMRVLAPDGVAYVKRGGQWQKKVKPRPAKFDEWTHFLHDSTNNAVSHDTAVDLPNHIQWIGGPKWARSHDHLASVSASVSAGGRLFAIVDEGPTYAAPLPAKWTLVARDAFNGVVLWKKTIASWEGHLRGFRTGPPELPRRLVAVGDRVYVTLGYGQPVTALDAATGDVVRTYSGTDGTVEIVYRDGVLFLVKGTIDLSRQADRRDATPAPRHKSLLAIQAETGTRLWEKSDADTQEVMPLTLAVKRDRAFFENPDAILCLDTQTGRVLWHVARPIRKRRWAWSTPTLVVYGNVVLSADRAGRDTSQDVELPDTVEWQVSSQGGEAPPGELIAYSAQTGHEVWRSECREIYNAPPDILITEGLLWSGDMVSARDPGITVARDVSTGEIKLRRPNDRDFFTFGMGHHRCYRNKATDKYLLLGRSGVEFVDTSTGKAVANHYVRGACQYGILPANGLLYVPPHSCACFIEAKLNGFNALAPARPSRGAKPESRAKERLERGPAFNDSSVRRSAQGHRNSNDWPTYRHDSARTGHMNAQLPTTLQCSWTTKLGGKLSSVVVAEGRLFVAQVDAHTVHALDAETGQTIWSYTAGGRVDSPPTVYEGRVLFGSADGYVYCLRATDGSLIWRFRAAPEDRRIVVYGQLESVWPVPGNVLVLNEQTSGVGRAVAYAVAGRTSYLDGGIFLARLDVRTGQLLSETPINSRDPQTDLPPQDTAHGVQMPGALPDVLSCDGQFVYMRHQRFDRQGVQQEPDVPHLFSAAGFLDGSWWHRTYWIYGTKMSSGWGGWTTAGNQIPAGRLLVVDDSSVYGYGRLNQYATHGSHVGLPKSLTPWPPEDRDNRARGRTRYDLFACSKSPEILEEPQGNVPKRPTASAASRSKAKKNKRRSRTRKQIVVQWSRPQEILVRGMLLANQNLYLAGAPDLLLPLAQTGDPSELAAAEAAYEGRMGGVLVAVSVKDGEKLAEYPLKSPPVYDGLIAAGNRLYLATVDGQVVCMVGN